MSIRSENEAEYDRIAPISTPGLFTHGEKGRTVDRWVVYDARNALESVHLNRYTGQGEIKQAIVEARRSLQHLEALMSADSRRRIKESKR